MSQLLSSNNIPKLGSLNVPPFLPTPPLPNFISEWAAIIPLVVHLATYRQSYQSIGEISLSGRVSLGPFPKLGVLAGLADLLKLGPEYLDRASTSGPSPFMVWDVLWGSTFPCANGAASTMIARYVLNHAKSTTRKMPESPTKTNMTTITTHEPATQSQPGSSIVDHFRRYQTLHVIHFERTAPKASRWNIVQAFKASKIYVGVTFVGFLGLAAVLCLLGLYGTSAVLLVSAISQLSLAYVNIRRPPGYLESNETSEGYMLTATHSNAMTWYLYMGDRGVIDTLLNKTMLFVRNDKQEQLCATWLRLAHGVQLLSMTFVAAQKGWDGVGLLVLVGIEWMIRWNTREQKLAGRWLRREGISAKVRSYEFTGRTVLLGAVQALSNSRITTWMDGIIVPHPRRDAWLGCLAKLSSGSHHGVESSWNEKDARFIIRSAALSAEAAAMIRQELEAEDEYDRNV